MLMIKKYQNGKSYYQGNSGTKYQYDLNNPTDQLAYQLDLNTQMRDKMSLSLNRKLDQKFGHNGGGILE